MAGQPRGQRHLGVQPVPAVTAARECRAGVGAGREPAARPAGSRSHGDDDVVELALGTPLPLAELSVDLFTLPGDEHAALVHDRGVLPVRPAGAAAGDSRRVLEERPAHGPRASAGHQRRAACVHALRDALSAARRYRRCSKIRPISARWTPSAPPARESPLCRSAPAARAVGDSRDRMMATAARLVYLTTTFQNPTGAVMPMAGAQGSGAARPGVRRPRNRRRTHGGTASGRIAAAA